MSPDSSATLHHVKRFAPLFFGATRYKSGMTYEDPSHHNGYIIQIATNQGQQQFLFPASAVAHLIAQLALHAQAAPSHELKTAMNPLTIESVSVGVLHGQTTLAASFHAGIELVSTIDRSDLERLMREIQAALSAPAQPSQ